MELKDRISEAMKSAKLTPAGLARAADVTKSAVFKDGNKWRLSDGSNTFFATISDDLFIALVESGSERFGKGDLLVVNLRRVQSITDAGLKTEVTVEQVIEHKAPLHQPLI
jgi:hypothetical protein